MTDNDSVQIPAAGYWTQVDPASSAAVLANSQMVPQYAQIPQTRPMDTTPATSGIVIDQKVLIALVLILGAIAGVMLMMILDKYASKSPKTYRAYVED